MAELATNIGVVPQTILASTSAINRGLRTTLASDGTVSVSAIGVRGDYITVNDVAASSYGTGHACGTGAKISALASEAVAIGDLAYSAASGKFSKTSTNAVLMGRWVQAASGDGVLGVVQLETVA